MNKTQQAQLAASSVSRDYFFSNFYNIPVVGKGAELFEMRDYQKNVVDTMDRVELLIGLKARQIGWTTIAIGYVLHDCLFNQEHPWLLVSRNEDASIKMLQKAMYAYNRFPKWLKDALPALVSSTQTQMVFANGSRIESVPATGSTGRGDSVWGALMDEAAFMEYAESIWGAVEPLVYGKAMVFSTANGMGNFFHDVWLDAQDKVTAWEALFYPWDVVPERDQHWYDRTKLAYKGREWLFYQEHPSSPEEAFSKSGRVAFTAESIDECFDPMVPVERWAWSVADSDAYEIGISDDADITVDIWKTPVVVRDELGRPLWKPNFVVSADIAEGLDRGDFTYVNVFDANTGEQCASSHSSIPVAYLDDFLDWLGRYYHNALMIPERNNAGIMPIELLYMKHMYPRLYRMQSFGEQTSSRAQRFGWYTDKRSKPKMVLDFQRALGERAVTIHDPKFVSEATTFISDGKGSYGASSQNHDDVITGTLIGWQGVLDSPEYPIVWVDPKTPVVTHDMFDEVGYVDEFVVNDVYETPLGQKVEDKVYVKKGFVVPPKPQVDFSVFDDENPI